MKNILQQLYSPNITIPNRLKLLTSWIGFGLIFSMIISWRLWVSTDREFPLVPMLPNIPVLPSPFDMILFGSFLLCCSFLMLYKKSRVWIALTFVLGIALLILDQTRLQPWFFQFMLFLFVLLSYNWRVDDSKNYTVIFTTIKIIICLTYFWSGINKMNSHFYSEVWPWLIQPFESFCTPEQCNYLLKFGTFVPFIECLMGLGLLFTFSKKIALPLVISMHIGLLILIGPLVHNYNPVIWGWNLSMIFILYFLFAGEAKSKYYQINYLFQLKAFYPVLFLVAIMPAFSLFNKWDSYISGNLYSGNTSQGVIYMNNKAKSKLPYYIQYFSKEESVDRHKLVIKDWALHELRVPGYPEKRVFEAVQQHLRDITCCDEEILLTVENRKNSFALK